MSDQWVKIGALWKSESKKGEKFLAGKMDSARLIVWPNGSRKSDASPDYIVYVTVDQKRDDGGQDNWNDESDRHDDVPF